MRLLIATLILAAPAMAMAQSAGNPIPEGMLAEHNRACVSECMQNRDRGFCMQTCNCVTAEMRDHWTADDYNRRAAGLSGDQGPMVRDELNQMTAYCVQQAQ